MSSAVVSAHIDTIENPFRETIIYLRGIFLGAHPEIAEHIKWNSPAFYYSGEMKIFDAKEYKRDLAVINLHRGKILIVFPTGNKINKAIALKAKDYPDGRKIVEVNSIEEAKNSTENLIQAINDWIDQIEK